MKKMPSVFLLVFSVLAFSSCSFETGISLFKRNHRDGYYFNFFSGKKWSPELNSGTIRDEKLKEQPSDIPIIIPPGNNSQNLPASLAHNKKEISKKPEDKKKVQQKRCLKNHLAKPKIFFEKTTTYRPEGVRIFSEYRSMAGADHEGGEIIWTIIGILILLWLLSLLTGGWGLGGLIYILLVVAIILAILRLLELL